MRVRVCDRQNNRYFKSEVYAIFNIGGWQKYVVLESGDECCHKAYSSRDRSGEELLVNINLITSEEPAGWITKREADLHEIRGLLQIDNARFFEYRGYDWILADIEKFKALVNGATIKIDPDQIKNSKLDGWNYVDSEEDAVALLTQTCHFHDSVFTKMDYVSGSAASGKGMLPLDSVRRVTMYIDSCICSSIEMVFEGVTAMNLRPMPDNYTSEILGAALKIQDETVLFCMDEDVIDCLPEDVTWIKSFGLRWRFISENTVISGGPCMRSAGIKI